MCVCVCGGGVEGEPCTFQPLTSVIRLSRAGKKIAGSVLVVAEDEKTRRLNKKTYVAHALWLIGCVPWIIPGWCCQLGNHQSSLAHAHDNTHANISNKHTHKRIDECACS